MSDDQDEDGDRESEPVEVTIKVPMDLPISQVDNWEKNPNVMSQQSMQDLTDDIISQGFDEPIGVFPTDQQAYAKKGHDAYVKGGGRFQCWNGNHRLMVMRDLEAQSIPGVVSPDMAKEDVAIQVVRRNMVRGALDPVRFAEMVNDDLFGIDHEVLARAMGFEESAKFAELIAASERTTAEVKDPNDAESDPSTGASSRGGEPIEGLATMISQIMARYGNTAPQSYLCFVWQDRLHYLGMMDDKTKRVVEKWAEDLESSGQNFNDSLTEMIEDRLSD